MHDLSLEQMNSRQKTWDQALALALALDFGQLSHLLLFLISKRRELTSITAKILKIYTSVF